MLFGIGSAPKYGNSFPIMGIPRLDGLTIMYGFYGIDGEIKNIENWKEIASDVCMIKEITITKKRWIQELHQEIETSITINNPSDIGFLQEPIEVRGGLGNNILHQTKIPFEELFREDVVFRMVCWGKNGAEFIISNKPWMSA